jgi:L-iditol 2-dehydrogenase
MLPGCPRIGFSAAHSGSERIRFPIYKGEFMKALVKFAPGRGNVAVMDMEEPVCGAGQVKIEVAYCGVCGTDLHVLHDTYRNYPPVILGHEIAGTVVEVGCSVHGVTPGDRVTVLGASAVTCGECTHCRSGNFIFCPDRRGMGHGVNGAFARYVTARKDQLFRLPEGFSLQEAALSEPFAAAVQAVTEVTKVRIGDTALVSGPGPMGLLCLKLLVAEGIRTIVAGAAGDGRRLEAARRIGASTTIQTGERDFLEAIREETGGRGIDVAFECAGHPDSVRACVQSLRPLGRYTQVGICGAEIQFPIDALIYKQLTMAGSMCYTVRTWERMMRIFAEGRVRLGDLITAVKPLSEWEAGFDLCVEKQALKVLLFPAE